MIGRDDVHNNALGVMASGVPLRERFGERGGACKQLHMTGAVPVSNIRDEL